MVALAYGTWNTPTWHCWVSGWSGWWSHPGTWCLHFSARHTSTLSTEACGRTRDAEIPLFLRASGGFSRSSDLFVGCNWEMGHYSVFGRMTGPGLDGWVLIFTCPMVQEAWRTAGVARLVASSHEEFWSSLIDSLFRRQTVWRRVFVTLWAIWIHKNEVIFKGVAPSGDAIQHAVGGLLYSWNRGGPGPSQLYPCNDWPVSLRHYINETRGHHLGCPRSLISKIKIKNPMVSCSRV